MPKRLLAWLLLAAWGIGLFAYTISSGERKVHDLSIFNYPGIRLPTGQRSLERILVRKIGHVVVFAIGALLAVGALGVGRMGLAWVLVAGIGVLDELHQAFISGRSSSLFDVLLNASAALLVLVVVNWLLRIQVLSQILSFTIRDGNS